MSFRIAAFAALSGVLAGGAAQAQDAAKGELLFKQCAVCHSTEPGTNKLGPSLAEVVGRKAGEEPGFNYSPAMRNSGKTWDKAALDAYLADPKGAVPGNKMVFPGLKDAGQRADVIAYLETLK